MPKTQPARYSIYWASAGCMPDSHYGVVECWTRRDLANTIRDALDFYDLPACRFREIGVAGLWRDIQRRGSEANGFTIASNAHEHDLYSLVFSGLSEEEYAELAAAEEAAA